MRRGRSKAKAVEPASPGYESGTAFADVGSSQSVDRKPEILTTSEVSHFPPFDAFLQAGAELSTCVEQFGEATSDGQNITDTGNDHDTPNNIFGIATHQSKVRPDISDAAMKSSDHGTSDENTILSRYQLSTEYPNESTNDIRLKFDGLITVQDIDLKTLSVVGATPQDITTLMGSDKRRPDASWASLIATSSWSNGDKQVQSPSGPAPEIGPIPYQPTAKA